MNRKLPPLTIALGIAGLLPFAVCALGALTTDSSSTATRYLLSLSAYAAVILSFLGGVHWGFGLDASGAPPAAVQRARFGLGVLPALVGWAALLVTFIGLPKTGLLVLAAGFVATTVAEARGAQRGWVPAAYMGLRWVLSAVVIVLLVSVSLVLAFGGKVVL